MACIHQFLFSPVLSLLFLVFPDTLTSRMAIPSWASLGSTATAWKVFTKGYLGPLPA